VFQIGKKRELSPMDGQPGDHHVEQAFLFTVHLSAPVVLDFFVRVFAIAIGADGNGHPYGLPGNHWVRPRVTGHIG
jgi:hypothetical protein